jgi:cellulose synthase/poly-beta-1,6-N-acetylglucosamine synthase-like glycosyltransferase
MINVPALLYIVGCVSYAILFLTLGIGLKRLEKRQIRPSQELVSVIIPARNEEKNLALCLSALLRQSYPSHLYEIIVVDDFSTDQTPAIASEYKKKHPSLQVIRLHENSFQISPKKKAIETGIRMSRGGIVLTTDADCIVLEKWIEIMAGNLNDETAAVSSWLLVDPGTRLLGKLESLDSLSLVGVGAAAAGLGYPFLGNGANLAYWKEIFLKLNGFAEHAEYASGDDDLLIQKISRNLHYKIRFVDDLEASVHTQATASWKAFFNQRIRWASKSLIYPKKLLPFGIFLYFFSLSIVAGIPLLFISGNFIYFSLGSLLVKLATDFLFMKALCSRIKIKLHFLYFLLADLLQILYIPIIATWGPFTTYHWKGRTFSQGRLNKQQ